MKNSLMLIVILFSICCKTWGNNTILPDSVLTIDHTYMYILSDPEMSQQIMDEIRQRELYEPWMLDWCQADLYYNTGKYRLAIHYFERVSKYDHIREDLQLHMDLLSTMMECYRMNNQLDETMQTAVAVLSLAKQLDNSAEQGRAYQFMGKVMFRQANKKLADEYFSLAEKHLKESGNFEYLYHFNLTLANLMDEFSEYEKAYEYIIQAELNLNQLQQSISDMPIDQLDYEKVRLYALASDILAKDGKKKQATEYYERVMNSPYSTDIRSQIYIVPYLLEIKEYEKAISISEQRLEILRAETDTVGRDMSAVLHYLIEGYQLSGETPKALSFAKHKIQLTETMLKKERENTAMELATIHSVQQKEALITEQENTLKRRNLLLTGSFIIVILATITIFLIILNLKRTKEKNRAMVRQIKEMLAYREQVEKREKEIEEIPGSGSEPATESEIDKLFVVADQRIRSEKLYLNPNLVRDDVIRVLSVKRNDFILAINKHADGNFTDYINDIRMELALKLLENSPDMSIEGVAESAGFGSVRSLYRLFKKKYNMSPAQYRKLLK